MTFLHKFDSWSNVGAPDRKELTEEETVLEEDCGFFAWGGSVLATHLNDSVDEHAMVGEADNAD